MLPRPNRLVKDADFKRLAKTGRSFSSVNFFLKTVFGGKNPPCFGIVISAKVSKKAVTRNLLKRRLSEIIFTLLPKMGAGRQVLLVAKLTAPKLTFAELKEEIEQLLANARII